MKTLHVKSSTRGTSVAKDFQSNVCTDHLGVLLAVFHRLQRLVLLCNSLLQQRLSLLSGGQSSVLPLYLLFEAFRLQANSEGGIVSSTLQIVRAPP